MSDNDNPNLSPLLLELIHSSRKSTGEDFKQPLSANEATAACLSLISDCSTNYLPVAAINQLTDFNKQLLDRPKEEILSALGRQVVVLEAAALRFQARANMATKLKDAETLATMSDRCSKTLLSALGALYTMSKDSEGVCHAV